MVHRRCFDILPPTAGSLTSDRVFSFASASLFLALLCYAQFWTSPLTVREFIGGAGGTAWRGDEATRRRGDEATGGRGDEATGRRGDEATGGTRRHGGRGDEATGGTRRHGGRGDEVTMRQGGRGDEPTRRRCDRGTRRRGDEATRRRGDEATKRRGDEAMVGTDRHGTVVFQCCRHSAEIETRHKYNSIR